MAAVGRALQPNTDSCRRWRPWKRSVSMHRHNLWEARSRPGCQGPQRICPPHILEEEVDGQKEEQGDQR